MVYVPVGRTFSVRMDKVNGPEVRACWFSPRDGRASRIGVFAARGVRRFTPPDAGELLDWVLVLDEAARNLPAPGEPRTAWAGPRRGPGPRPARRPHPARSARPSRLPAALGAAPAAAGDCPSSSASTCPARRSTSGGTPASRATWRP